jgi:hypothetical protein
VPGAEGWGEEARLRLRGRRLGLGLASSMVGWGEEEFSLVGIYVRVYRKLWSFLGSASNNKNGFS